ncbi:MAG: DUF1285 domain-containing protein [Pseudomonadales bacterium]
MSEELPPAYGLLSELSLVDASAPPPIDRWNPERRYPIDMIINEKGEWFYQGSVIARPRLVRLFASVLKRIDEAYYLVTPSEACQIDVADAPFIGIGLTSRGSGRDQALALLTNVGDEVEISVEHPLRFRERAGVLIPYVQIRQGLEAKLNRNTYYDLMHYLNEPEAETESELSGIWSKGMYFEIAPQDVDR